MLGELLGSRGVEEHLELRSPVGFMALHGGLEATTYEIAHEASRRSDSSLYAVVQPDDLTWHVPSHRFDPAESERLAAFCDHVEVAISVHGYGGVREHPNRWLTIAVGGGGRAHAGVVGRTLRDHLDGYEVIDELDEIPPQYRGVHPANPVNLVRGAGVQVELPPRVRGTSPVWSDHDFGSSPFVPHTLSLVEALVEAAALLHPASGPT
ncbi:MAG: hypothetical protein GY812_06405 [Actinomycetia bacterium]|nr:hypothetical protein [Actinomycetes bacterium]